MLAGNFNILLLTLLIFTKVTYGGGLHVKGGATFGAYRLTNSRPNTTPAFGVNSSAYYLLDQIEVGIGSMIFLGENNNFIIEGDNDYVIGEGEQYHSYFYPYVKYKWEKFGYKSLKLYVGAGITWSLISTQYENIDTTNLTNLNPRDFKYTQTNFGFLLMIGLKSEKNFLWGQSAYIEFILSQNYSQSIKLIDTKDELVVNLLKQSDAFLKNRTTTAMINLGLTIF